MNFIIIIFIISVNLVKALSQTHHEEGHGGSSMDGTILDVGLVGQIVRRLNGHFHPLDSEKRCQVGRVRRNDDERKRPPDKTGEGQV